CECAMMQVLCQQQDAEVLDIMHEFDAKLTALDDSQRQELNDWIQNTQQKLDLSTEHESLSRTRSIASNSDKIGGKGRLEDSFTVHLGAQMKSSHNLRLVHQRAIDLCKLDHHRRVDNHHFDMERLQLLMELYGEHLRGVVVIEDERQVEAWK